MRMLAICLALAVAFPVASAMELVPLPGYFPNACGVAQLFVERSELARFPDIANVHYLDRGVDIVGLEDSPGVEAFAYRDGVLDAIDLAVHLGFRPEAIDLACAARMVPGARILPVKVSGAHLLFFEGQGVDLRAEGYLDLFTHRKWMGVTLEEFGLFERLRSGNEAIFGTILRGTVVWELWDEGEGRPYRHSEAFVLSDASLRLIEERVRSALRTALP